MSGVPGGQQVSEDHSTLRGQPEGSETRYTIGLKGSVDDRWAEAFRLTQAESPVFLRFRLDRASSSISFSCRTVDGAVLVFDVLERRTAQSAHALRKVLGPIRLEPVTPDIGRPFYRAITSLDALALIETPSGAEGGSNSLRRWRRRESNPRPRSRERWRLRA